MVTSPFEHAGLVSERTAQKRHDRWARSAMAFLQHTTTSSARYAAALCARPLTGASASRKRYIESVASGLDLGAAASAVSRRAINSLPFLLAALPASSMTQIEVDSSVKRKKYDGSNQEYVVLNDGNKMPLLGLGTAKADDAAAEKAVSYAIGKAGYKHIDTASMYKNEKGVGKGLKAAKNRKDVFVTTKLGNSDHGRVAEAVKEQLSRLDTDYIDLFLIHWPLTENAKNGDLDPPTKETWQEMEKLVDQGLLRSIGVSNFSVKKLKDVFSYARIPPAVNQVEVHAWFKNRKTVEYCLEKGVQITAYSPAGGIPVYDGPRPTEDPDVIAVAKKHNKTPFQVLLRWNIQYGTCVIPKSVDPERIDEDADIWDWEIEKDDFDRIYNAKTELRMGHGKWFLEGSPYKDLDDLWDGETGRVPPNA